MPAITASPVAPGASTVAAPAASASVREFLAWVDRSPRTYADVVEVWRSSCPRFSVWEDALHDGLVQLQRAPGGKFGEDRVTLTMLGQMALASA